MMSTGLTAILCVCIILESLALSFHTGKDVEMKLKFILWLSDLVDVEMRSFRREYPSSDLIGQFKNRQIDDS